MRTHVLRIIAISLLGVCLLCGLAKMAMKNENSKKSCDNACGALMFVALALIGVSQLSDEKEKYEGYDASSAKKQEIAKLTDMWIDKVTKKNDPKAVAKMFCKDGNLVATVSQVIREGDNIRKYFDFFAKLPEIEVKDKKYSISKITPDVYVNTAFITWKWKGLTKPIVVRMTFVFRNKCIFQLHASVVPELNEPLKNISGLP